MMRFETLTSILFRLFFDCVLISMLLLQFFSSSFSFRSNIKMYNVFWFSFIHLFYFFYPYFLFHSFLFVLSAHVKNPTIHCCVWYVLYGLKINRKIFFPHPRVYTTNTKIIIIITTSIGLLFTI